MVIHPEVVLCFSSRRRHTRFKCDWSSDVCSSDLAVVIVASLVQITWFRLRNGRFEKMHLFTMVLVTVLGGLTLALHAKSFVMWKPTAVNWAFAAVFLGRHFIGKQPIIRRLLGTQIELPDRVWSRLSLLRGAFFL